VEAQKWLDQNYPKEERGKLIELDIRSNELLLEGSLDLTDFKDLRLLICSGHKINKLVLGSSYSRLKELLCDNNQLSELTVKNCPKLIKINCSRNQLSKLTIDNCLQLESLNCSNNLLTSFDFESLRGKKLILIDLNNNRLSPRNLDELSTFISLESIDIGSDDQKEIKRGNYNHFNGSLKSLKNMTRLRYLNIEATDIEEGLGYLPESLEFFLCSSGNTPTGVGDIEEVLKEFSDSLRAETSSTPQLALSQSQNSSFSNFPVVEEEKTVFSSTNFGFNYFDSLQK